MNHRFWFIFIWIKKSFKFVFIDDLFFVLSINLFSKFFFLLWKLFYQEYKIMLQKSDVSTQIFEYRSSFYFKTESFFTIIFKRNQINDLNLMKVKINRTLLHKLFQVIYVCQAIKYIIVGRWGHDLFNLYWIVLFVIFWIDRFLTFCNRFSNRFLMYIWSWILSWSSS